MIFWRSDSDDINSTDSLIKIVISNKTWADSIRGTAIIIVGVHMDHLMNVSLHQAAASNQTKSKAILGLYGTWSKSWYSVW